MAGGVGSRFWPVSTEEFPKQFHDMLGTGDTLIQKTFNRLAKLIPQENIFILIPIAPNIEDSEATRDKYLDYVLDKLKLHTGEDIRENITYKRSFCVADFKSEYNSFKGNAYGLANTLLQTANLKPKVISKHISNLFYTGQLTVPGPGVPPSLISGQIVADYILKHKS